MLINISNMSKIYCCSDKIKFQLKVLSFYCKKEKIARFCNLHPKYMERHQQNRLKILMDDDCVHEFFDKMLGWSGTTEGFKYWYFHQIKFVILLIMISKKRGFNTMVYKQYLAYLLTGYSCRDYIHDEEWLNFKKIALNEGCIL